MKVPVRMSVTPFHCHAPADISSPFTHRFLYTESLKGGVRVLGDTSLEAVLEATGDILEVPQAAGADGLSALGLLAPVVLSGLSRGVSA